MANSIVGRRVSVLRLHNQVSATGVGTLTQSGTNTVTENHKSSSDLEMQIVSEDGAVIIKHVKSKIEVFVPSSMIISGELK